MGKLWPGSNHWLSFGYRLQRFEKRQPHEIILQLNMQMCVLRMDKICSAILWIQMRCECFLQGWETSYGHPVAPCFGLAFSAYVHTRIFVERTDQVIKTSNQEDKSTSTASAYCWMNHFISTAGGFFNQNSLYNHSVHSSAPLINPLIEYFKVRLRTAQVDFCPFLPSSEKVHFVVTSSGIRGVRVSEWQVVTDKNLPVPNIARYISTESPITIHVR